MFDELMRLFLAWVLLTCLGVLVFMLFFAVPDCVTGVFGNNLCVSVSKD